MKYLSVIAVALLCCLQTHAQDKFFEQALKDGRSKGGTYLMVNPKGKWLSQNDVEKYAKAKDLLLGSCEYKLVNRFGKPAETIISLQFLPRSEYPQFIFENIFPKANFSALKSTGKAVLPNKLSDNAVFKLYDNVLWSGEVDANGYISGLGSGFFEDGFLFRYFSGFFRNGQPQGDMDFIDYSHHNYLHFIPTEIITAKLFVDDSKKSAQLVVNTPAIANTNTSSDDSYSNKDPMGDLAIVLIGTGLIAYGLFKLIDGMGTGDSYYSGSYSSSSRSYSSYNSSWSNEKKDEKEDNKETDDKKEETKPSSDNDINNHSNEITIKTAAHHCTVKIMQRGSSGNEWPVQYVNVSGEVTGSFLEGGFINGRTDKDGICTLEWDSNTKLKKVYVSCGFGEGGSFLPSHQNYEGPFEDGGSYTLYYEGEY